MKKQIQPAAAGSANFSRTCMEMGLPLNSVREINKLMRVMPSDKKMAVEERLEKQLRDR